MFPYNFKLESYYLGGLPPARSPEAVIDTVKTLEYEFTETWLIA